MYKRLLIAIFILIGSFLAWAIPVQAGFGISPPYVRTDKPIFPGSTFEQTITLLRSSAEDDLQAKITINAPEIEDWITIDQGEIFTLPKGELQVPMVVRIDVPDKIAIGNYRGHINVRVVPQGGKNDGGVAIALGARVEIDLNITDQSYLDFIVRKIEIPNFETLSKPWNWKIFSRFFYRIKVVLNIENTGNTKVAPSKVYLEVFDIAEKEKLESGFDRRIKKVDPFTTGTTVASFPTSLSPGQYWGKIKIYKENDIIQNSKIAFTIYPAGESPAGKTALGYWPWVMLGSMIFACLLFVLLLIKIKIWRYIYKLFYLLSWPLRFVWNKISKLFNIFKIKTMKWLHRKSAAYKDKEETDTDKQE